MGFDFRSGFSLRCGFAVFVGWVDWFASVGFDCL